MFIPAEILSAAVRRTPATFFCSAALVSPRSNSVAIAIGLTLFVIPKSMQLLPRITRLSLIHRQGLSMRALIRGHYFSSFSLNLGWLVSRLI